MSEALTINHDLGQVVVKPKGKVNQTRLKKVMRLALDQYIEEDRISAKVLHKEIRERHADDYKTPGYFLRLYRNRADMTQKEIAIKTGIRQHHISEIENNKRTLGKANAKKLAKILDCDFRRLL